jgi:hypothetical protein
MLLKSCATPPESWLITSIFLRFHDLRFQLLAFRPIFNFPHRTAHRRKQSREISLGDTVCRAAPERINGQLLVKRSGNEDKRYD